MEFSIAGLGCPFLPDNDCVNTFTWRESVSVINISNAIVFVSVNKNHLESLNISNGRKVQMSYSHPHQSCQLFKLIINTFKFSDGILSHLAPDSNTWDQDTCNINGEASHDNVSVW